MKILIFSVLILISSLQCRGDDREDLSSQIKQAKERISRNYLSNLWYGASETMSDSQEKVLRLYNQYTVQQSQHVADHISHHQNITRSESIARRSRFLSMQNASNIVPTLQCLFANEIQTLAAYKMTGYNLQNCIINAQHETEAKYQEIIGKLNSVQELLLHDSQGYLQSLENCADESCITSILLRASLNYEKLQQYLFTNVTEINNLSTRYIFSHIAMGCIASSLNQVSENYKIGSDLAEQCFVQANETLPGVDNERESHSI